MLFRSRPLVVAATNPCPCGWWGVSVAEHAGAPTCRCSDAARGRYVRRLAGPLLDRFDLRVLVTPSDPDELLAAGGGEASADVARRVAAVRALSRARGVRSNAELGGQSLREWASLASGARRLVESRLRNGSLTARGLDRVKRVARTLADLDGTQIEGPLSDDVVAMALELRRPVLPDSANGLAA